jgi:hypothetical protein
MRSVRPREVLALPFRNPVLFVVALAFSGLLYAVNLQASLYDIQNPRWVITMATLLLLSPLFAGVFILLVREVERGEGRLTVGRAVSRTLVVYGPLVVGELVVNLGVAFGMLLFVVPGIYLGLRWSLYKQAILVDGKGALAGMRTSFDRTRSGRALIELFVALSACYAPTVIFGYATLAVQLGVAADIIALVLSTLTFAWANGFLTLRYLRGTDVEAGPPGA